MKLAELFDFVVTKGIENDPRGRDEVEKALARAKKQYDALKDEDKKDFDLDKLKNPYADSRILFGDPETEVGTALVGIDMEVGEVIIADRLSEKGEKIDLIISHHPEGKALAALADVMALQPDLWQRLGVPINVGEGLMSKRSQEVFRNLMPINHNRAVDAAKLFGIPFMSAHTPADNMVTAFLQALMDNNNPDTVKDVVDLLKEVPEYAQATRDNAGPTIVVGSGDRRAGKIWIDMTGGTEGPKEAIEKLADAGVGTFVCMHASEKHTKAAEEHNINIIIAGHMASDSIGLNLLLDQLESRGVKIIPCSGLIRVNR